MSPRPQLGVGQYGNIHASKQGSTWVALARFRDVDGETRRVKAQGSSKSASIQALRDKLVARAARGGGDNEIDSESTVKELAAKYLALKEQEDLAPNTKYRIRLGLDKHVLPRIGKLRLREVTPQRVQGMLNRVVAESGAGAATNVRGLLSAMFSTAALWGAVQANPVSVVPPPKRARSEVRALTLGELGRMRAFMVEAVQPLTVEKRLANAEAQIAKELKAGKLLGPADPMKRMGGAGREPSTLDLLDFLLATGCRAGEAPGLAWEDVHLDAPVPWVMIRQQVVRVNGEGLKLTPTKERDERSLRLPPFAIDMLRRRQSMATGPMVFPNRNGGLRATGNIWRTWNQIFAGSEWDWVTSKTLRKTVATLVARGSGSALAANQLGHADDSMTKRHYIARDLTPIDAGTVLDGLVAIEATEVA